MKEQAEKETELKSAAQPRRQRLPETRKGLVHKFRVGETKGYIRVGLYPDGSLGEVFLSVAKEGSTLSGMMDCFATLLSLSLQHGIPLDVIAKKFRHIRFEPDGLTGGKEIPTASSLIDYVFAWLELNFLGREVRAA